MCRGSCTGIKSGKGTDDRVAKRVVFGAVVIVVVVRSSGLRQ
jgi:hypothetical protein